MEPSVKWAGNPNITIAAKAFELRATVQVDLQVFASPCITLKPLVLTFPCFAKNPHVDFGLKLLGADAMSIPDLIHELETLNTHLYSVWAVRVKATRVGKALDGQGFGLRIKMPFKDDEIPKETEDLNAVEKAPEGTPEGGGLLVVIVYEAQDLEGKHHMNPQVRLLF
ncbi:synaptotagmin A [Actinidia rufa]|uniref:Synaptotagmin A n=1 Tax=Actinidia rufa TaxID=165716 RepID=A0A7J0EAV0_9ERIC|nr:synaptotagmin A [Actinidia rufa]